MPIIGVTPKKAPVPLLPTETISSGPRAHIPTTTVTQRVLPSDMPTSSSMSSLANPWHTFIHQGSYVPLVNFVDDMKSKRGGDPPFGDGVVS
jgi:hypothetical protein